MHFKIINKIFFYANPVSASKIFIHGQMDRPDKASWRILVSFLCEVL